jgi:hypothetical protein
MPRKPANPPDDPEQSKRFIDMAREVEATGTKEEFERVFKKVAKEKPRKPSK